jgi:hypothetical protein
MNNINNGSSKKNNSKPKKSKKSTTSSKKKSVRKPSYRQVPEHNPELLSQYVTDSNPDVAGVNELNIRIYLYGADGKQSRMVHECLAELFGEASVHPVEHPFKPDEFMEEIFYGDFEQTPGVGIPRTKPVTHVYRISGQYGTSLYHKIHPMNHPENDQVLTQMEYKIGHAVQEKTNNKVIMFQHGTLGAYGPNTMLIGLQTAL